VALSSWAPSLGEVDPAYRGSRFYLPTYGTSQFSFPATAVAHMSPRIPLILDDGRPSCHRRTDPHVPVLQVPQKEDCAACSSCLPSPALSSGSFPPPPHDVPFLRMIFRNFQILPISFPFQVLILLAQRTRRFSPSRGVSAARREGSYLKPRPLLVQSKRLL